MKDDDEVSLLPWQSLQTSMRSQNIEETRLVYPKFTALRSGASCPLPYIIISLAVVHIIMSTIALVGATDKNSLPNIYGLIIFSFLMLLHYLITKPMGLQNSVRLILQSPLLVILVASLCLGVGIKPVTLFCFIPILCQLLYREVKANFEAQTIILLSPTILVHCLYLDCSPAYDKANALEIYWFMPALIATLFAIVTILRQTDYEPRDNTVRSMMVFLFFLAVLVILFLAWLCFKLQKQVPFAGLYVVSVTVVYNLMLCLPLLIFDSQTFNAFEEHWAQIDSISHFIRLSQHQFRTLSSTRIGKSLPKIWQSEKCNICSKRQALVMNSLCDHVIACQKCFMSRQNINYCPICQQQISLIIRTLFIKYDRSYSINSLIFGSNRWMAHSRRT